MTIPTSSGGLMAVLCTGEQLLSRVERLWVAIAAMTIMVMMGVTVIDVIMRYGFNSPLRWWFDVLMNYLLLTPFFLSFSYTLAHHGHLAVDFFSRRIHPPLLHTLLAVAYTGTGLVLSAVTIFTFDEAYSAWLANDVVAGVILWPMWISKAIIALGTLPLSLRCLHFAIGHSICIRQPDMAARLRIASTPDVLKEA